MKLSRNSKLFIAGFTTGTLLLGLLVLAISLFSFDAIDQIFSTLLPTWWLFDANPLLLLLCSRLLSFSGLCIGLGFDGGPLEWAEITWLFISPGVLYGLVFLLVGNAKNAWRKIQTLLAQK